MELLEHLQLYLNINVERFEVLLKEKRKAGATGTAGGPTGQIDRAKLQLPRGRVSLALNQDFGERNVVDIFGMRFQSNDQMKAIYLFMRKIKQLLTLEEI